jgi:predicted dienelactone hydrolase
MLAGLRLFRRRRFGDKVTAYLSRIWLNTGVTSGVFTGIRQFELIDGHTGDRIPMAAMYPTTTLPTQVKLGPYTEQLSPDAPVAAGKHLLIAISHGSGGSHLAYRTLASHLACSGCVVALPEHPGNNRNDNRLEGTLENLQARPRSISLAIDAVMADPMFAPHVSRDTAAVIGHSMGGYTALAAAGGVPRFPPESGNVVDVQGDDRVKAVVLMAPATPWFFAEGALAGVNVPVLMFTAEHDPYTSPWHAEVVARGLPDPSLLTHRRVPNAGHFSFLSPYPLALRTPGFLPATDPEGFDREKFQRDLGEQILSFLRDALARVRAA